MTVSLPTISPHSFVMLTLIVILSGIIIQKMPERQHKLLVSVVSLCLIAWIDLLSCLILLSFAHLGYFAISAGHRRRLNVIAWSMIAALMAIKGLQAIQRQESADLFTLIGVSYYTFRIASALFDVAGRRIRVAGYLDFMNYCLFFPIFIGGPVQRYRTFSRNGKIVALNIQTGVFLLFRALIKKVLLADIVLLFLIRWLSAQIEGSTIFSLADEGGLVWKNSASLEPVLAVPLYGFASIVRAYFDLSAFTDLALGLGAICGYDIAPNFRKPFLATNIIDFWRRWHLTIAGWAKDYVFSPLMLSTRNLPLAVLFTMISMGLWHELSARWLLWGACHGLGLVICGWWQGTPIRHSLLAVESRLLATVAHLEETAGVGRGMAMVLRPICAFAFWLPAWIINFGFMSLVFVVVSTPTFATAMTYYAKMLS